MGKIATVTGIGKTPRTLATALGNITPLWNSTSSIQRHLDLRGQGHRSRSRSLQRENFGGVFYPFGVIRSRPNLVGTLGMTPAIEMPKVAKIGQRVRNGGGVKVFGVPHLCDTLSKMLKFFFCGIAPTYAQDISSSRWESRFSHSRQLWEIQPPKDPPFPGFSRFCQSLAPNDVTAVADTRACYTSLERAQKIEQNGNNTIFNFASLGKARPPKIRTLKKRHFVPSSRQRCIGYAWRNLTQLT